MLFFNGKLNLKIGDDVGRFSPAGEPSLPTGVLVQLRSWLEDSEERPRGLPPPM